MPPRLARLLAILGVLALVAGAFVLRGSLSDDDDTVTAGSGQPPPEQTDPEGPSESGFEVLCDRDLGEAACAAVASSSLVDQVEVVDGGRVADMLADPDGERWDAVVTLDPMPGMLASDRRPTIPAVAEDVVAIASSPLAVLTFEGTPLTCADAATWQCLTEPVNPAVTIADPSTSVGTVTLGAAAAGLMGTTDFGIFQFNESPAHDQVVDLLRDVPTQAGRDTADQTSSLYRPGSASAAVTYGGLATLAPRQTSQGVGRGLARVGLTPRVDVGVVLAGLGDQGDDATRALDDLVTGQTVRDALAAAGWGGDPALSDGLPDPDVIYALVEEFS